MRPKGGIISPVVVATIFLALFTAVGLTDAAARQVEDPIWTDSGYIAGTLMDLQSLPALPDLDLPGLTVGELGKTVHVYRGIPYAAPPVGGLRWRPPQPVTPWPGIRECAVPNKWPTQQYPAQARYGSVQESGMSEDCLYLNIMTPATKTTDRLPVMVWFHGGGYTSQSGSRDIYNSPGMAQQGIIYVSVTHRLGVMGYMAHPALTAESPVGASGNYGMLDLVASLQWIKKNIAAFGGDPNRVTIFGQSGGGGKVLWLMTSPLSKGLFRSAIAQSASGGGTTLPDAEQMGVSLAAKLGIADGPDALKELRAKSWEDVVNASLATDSGFKTDITIDGWSTPDTYANVFKAGMQHNVPFIIGIAEKDIASIFTSTVDLVSNMTPVSSNTWVYEFTYVPSGWKSEGAKAWHSLENGYVFGNYEYVAPINYGNYGIPAGATTPDPGFDGRDPWMSDFMMQTWIRFATTGDPNLPGCVIQNSHSCGHNNHWKNQKSTQFEGVPLPRWNPYTASTDQYLVIDFPPKLNAGYSELVYK